MKVSATEEEARGNVDAYFKNENTKYFVLDKNTGKIVEKGGNTMKFEDTDDDTRLELNEEVVEKATKEDILRNVNRARTTSGYGNVEEYKQAISSGMVKNYSRAQLKMWERMEKLLKEMENNDF